MNLNEAESDDEGRAIVKQTPAASLSKADPAAIAFVVSRLRVAGNSAFKEKRYAGALNPQISSTALNMQQRIRSVFIRRLGC